MSFPFFPIFFEKSGKSKGLIGLLIVSGPNEVQPAIKAQTVWVEQRGHPHVASRFISLRYIFFSIKRIYVKRITFKTGKN